MLFYNDYMKFEKIQKIIIQFFIFLLPLFFLPVTRDSFDFNKNFLLIVFALTLILLFSIKTIIKKKLDFKLSSFDIPVFLLFVSVLLSLILVTPNRVDSLINPLGAGTFFALIIIYFFLRQFALSKKEISASLLASASVLGLFVLFQFVGITGKLSVPDIYKNRLFTPVGSLLNLLTFLFVCLVIAVFKLYKENNAKIATDYKNILLFVSSLLIVTGFAVTMLSVTKAENRPLFMPYSSSWSVSAQTMQNPQNGLFGVGLGNYLNAFTRFKPVQMNQGELWRVRFAVSSNLYFQVLSELGLLGFAALVFLLMKLLRSKLNLEDLLLPLLILLIGLFIPAGLLLLLIFFLFLSLLSLKSSKYSFVFPKGESAQIDSVSLQVVFFVFPFIAAAGFAFYFLGRAYRAELLMSKGIVQAARGNAQLTYDFQKEAVLLNPYFSPYRIIFSQTNYALAFLVGQKKELTDEDKNTLVQLLTQSINNAKLAINLNPGVIAWENIADLYRRITGISTDAVSWSEGSFNQAVKFDPANPILRVAFGQLYYANKAYDAALRQFQSAVILKDDFANGWYNVANTLREMGNIQGSRAAYEKTLTLVESGTNDYERVKKEMDALPKEPKTPITSERLETLTSPASPSADIKEEVNLNREEVAPEVSVTPSPVSSESAGFETEIGTPIQ